MTAEELATLCGTGPRFTKEWLLQQTSADILDTDLAGGEPRFHLSAEMAGVLLGSTGTGDETLARALVEAFASFAPQAHRLVDAWRHDRSGFLDTDRAMLAQEQARLTAVTATDLPGRLAAVPELAGILSRQPLRVAELGCGAGLHLAAMAAAWPHAVLIGYDVDEVALGLAAQRLGSNPRVRLRHADARRVADDKPFDLILAVDALHDMPDPSGVLSAARTSLADGGIITVVEVAYRPEFTADPDEVDRLGYLSSLFNCLHHQLEHSGQTAIGAVARESDIRAWGTAARLPSCVPHDTEPDGSRLFVLRPR